MRSLALRDARNPLWVNSFLLTSGSEPTRTDRITARLVNRSKGLSSRSAVQGSTGAQGKCISSTA